MPYELADIENILKEHEAINAHMQTISTLAEDRDIKQWIKSKILSSEQLQVINTKWLTIQQTFNYLQEGIRIHIDHEDKVFSELVGNPLTTTINLEHNEIHKQLTELNSFITRNGPREFLANREHLGLTINQLCCLIQEHEEKESVILTLLKKQFIP